MSPWLAMPEILKGFPDTRWHPDLRLMTWHPRGVLDDDLADRVMAFIESEERIAEAPFNRYTDFSGLTGIRLTFGHAFQLAERRKVSSVGCGPVKSAIFCDWIVGFGMARLYAALMRGSPIDLRAFRTREEAAEWLEVPMAALCVDADASID
jgi:hypothetical protein